MNLKFTGLHKSSQKRFSSPQFLVILVIILAVSLVLQGIPGCSKKQNNPNGEKSYIHLKGSDTILYLAHSWAKSFGKTHPDIEISISGGGSATGINALLENTVDICTSSRTMNDEEIKQAGENNIIPNELIVAWDGIAIVVHPDNPINEMSVDQIKQVFTGEITQWGALGGNPDDITVLIRETNSGTYAFFQKYILKMNNYSSRAQSLPANSAIIQRVANDINAIGYVGLGYAQEAQEKNTVKMIAVKARENAPAILPSVQSVMSEKYLISRPLHFYVNGEPSGPTKEFIDFCLSPEGQQIVKESGYVNAKTTLDFNSVSGMIFLVMGGLGIFLLGMKNMSEGMQAVAGAKLRKLINAITNNRLIACGVGTLVTCLIQSSSVTTVMVVGMVNAGIMNLVQAIGVILGANIGTTITGWILVLKIGKYGLPLIGFSVFFYLFSKKDKVRYTASLLVGLGMVFYGLQLMKSGFAPLKNMPEFEIWFSRFSPESYFGVIKCCLSGAILTAIVQSSSATLGITMALAATGVIDFPTAAALVLGENIGTTITAWLASLGASPNAKRASYAHIIVNIAGVIWITSIFPMYIGLVENVVSYMENTFGLNPETSHIERCIAATHTGFNVVNVMVFLPFITLLGKFLNWLVPEKHYKSMPHLTFLDVRMLDTPAIGIQQSQKEIIRMSNENSKMISTLGEIIARQKPDKDREENIFRLEKELDLIQKEIVEFLGNITSGNISHDVIDHCRRQLRMADEYESISDYITNILKLNLKLRDKEQTISEDGLQELIDLHDKVAKYIELINEAVREEDDEILPEAQTKGNAITHLMKKYRSSHLARVGTGSTTPMKSLMYMDMLNSYRRIKDHAYNIAEVLAGEK
ncbi:MAG: phosphate ABC transporter substrate-binding protein PstS family protein [Sedimentisphaerales bacterium]|nr:phosphate ABC transporter substrate-binding protein PstS family protein [Sedimentisphaerales bacterium]